MTMTMARPQETEGSAERVQRLFEALADGALDRFVAGCCDDLVLTVHGSGPMTTMVARDHIPSWYRSMQQLAGASFRADVSLVLTEDRTHVVLLTHVLVRAGHRHHYETINRCTLRHGRLASWFSYPVRPSEYARAWGIPAGGERLPA